ncbi:RNA polymerase sigma factor [Desulfoferrobacter suflitae]|uniref:RNA polymerase sigma factor n=1 Tax=Desulfoferrobacter suflitae TaxID=2865782 RepID=UPI00216434B8|nr:RNA polymerase sigma factor [Desulfoferrobacter suflitae]MCK8604188.1 RNA polymerase sigma factor [Desulfoferrobacter suflitae]
MDQTTEHKIILEILDGNPQAFGILISTYERPIYSLFLRMTGCTETSADLAQETFMQAYEKLDQFDPRRRFFSWLYAIGLNKARDYLRRQKAARETPLEDCQANTGNDAGSDIRKEIQDRIDGARILQVLTLLPLEYREALVLRYQRDLSMKEIAQALGMSVSGAKMRVHRGLAMLREIMREGAHGKRD